MPSYTPFAMRCDTVRQPSDIDVAFPAGAGDEDLMSALRRVLPAELKGTLPDLVLYGKRMTYCPIHVVTLECLGLTKLVIQQPLLFPLFPEVPQNEARTYTYK